MCRLDEATTFAGVSPFLPARESRFEHRNPPLRKGKNGPGPGGSNTPIYAKRRRLVAKGILAAVDHLSDVIDSAAIIAPGMNSG